MDFLSTSRYINFPIQLLQGFLRNPAECLNNILLYGLYAFTEKVEFRDRMKNIQAAMRYYRVDDMNPKYVLQKGETLYLRLHRDTPKAGIEINVFWDFVRNPKTEFEKVCLLGFLAFKSILQDKSYCKITNKFWLSRMDGKAKCVKEISELSPEIRRFHNEYQTKKIKSELRDSWGLKTYSRYTRGFYVSFKLTLEELITVAENRRKTRKEKLYKEHEKEILKRVLEKLNNNNSSRG